MKNKKKRGFTLIELLAVILLLAIVFSIVFVTVGDLGSGSKEKISKASENLIKDTVKSYASEFKRDENWHQEETINSEGKKEVSYCVNLDSLIDKGYFKNDNTELNDLRSKYYVFVKEVDGVVVSMDVKEKSELNEVNSDGLNNCQYYNPESSTEGDKYDNYDLYYEVDDEDIYVANLNYRFIKKNDFNYTLKLDLENKLEVDSIPINKNVDLIILLDTSGSMMGTKFQKAKQAAIDLSESFLDSMNEINNKNSRNSVTPRIGLIQFSTKGNEKSRDLSSEGLSTFSFKNIGENTNVQGAIDEAIYMFNTSNSSEDALKYTLLLYDGVPCEVSYYMKDGKKMIPIKGKTDYYDNYAEYRNVLKMSISSDYDVIEASAEYLKNNIHSELITIGYEFSGNSTLKELSSQNESMCNKNNYKENYCYFTSNSEGINELFNSIGKSIKEDVLNKIANSITIEIEIGGAFENKKVSYELNFKNGEITGNGNNIELSVNKDIFGESSEVDVEIINSIKYTFKDANGQVLGSTEDLYGNFPKVKLVKKTISKLN